MLGVIHNSVNYSMWYEQVKKLSALEIVLVLYHHWENIIKEHTVSPGCSILAIFLLIFPTSSDERSWNSSSSSFDFAFNFAASFVSTSALSNQASYITVTKKWRSINTLPWHVKPNRPKYCRFGFKLHPHFPSLEETINLNLNPVL